MPYAVTCKACGARFSVGDDLYRKRVAGKFVTINCKSCRAPIRLDGAEAPTRRNSSRPPSATRSFPSRPPMPPGPTRIAPARLPSIQRTQLGGLSARGPAAASAQPRPGGSPPVAVQQTAARAAPSPPRPTKLGNLPVPVPPAPQHLAEAGGDQEEEATTPFGGFYDVSAELESVPPSAGSVDLTDEVEALPPSVPLATQFARSRVPHPPKKVEAKDDAVDGVSLEEDDPDFLLGLRRGATVAPKAEAPKAAAPATSSPATTTPTPPTSAKVAAAPAAEAAKSAETTKSAETAKPAETAKSTGTAKPAEAALPMLQPSLSEMLQPPSLLSSPQGEPIVRKKSSSAGAVLALFVLSLAAVGVYRYLNTDSTPAEEAETAVAPPEPPEAAVARAEPPPAEPPPTQVAPPPAPEPPPAEPPPPAAEPPVAAAPAAATPTPQPRTESAVKAPASTKPAPAPAAATPAEDKPATTKAPKPTGPVGPFDRAAAAASLSQAASQASSCKKAGDPSGTTSVTVSFAPSGRVTSATLSGPPFAGTATGSCIASTLRRATVPPFEGERTTVSKTVVIN